jgi:hypothetical protein
MGESSCAWRPAGSGTEVVSTSTPRFPARPPPTGDGPPGPGTYGLGDPRRANGARRDEEAIPIGAGLLLDFMFPSAEAYLAMNQSEAGLGQSVFYGLVNTLREWLLVPLALLLSWHLPRRRPLLLAMVAVLYIERVITYLYFAPTVLGWQDTTPAETTPALLDEVRQWMALDWVRAPVDWFVLVALMVVVVAYPRAGGGAHRAAAGGSLPRRRPDPVHRR